MYLNDRGSASNMTSLDEDKDGKLRRAWEKFCAIVREAKTNQTSGEVNIRATLNCGVTNVAVTQTVSIK
jgi:hypothetical protein